MPAARIIKYCDDDNDDHEEDDDFMGDKKIQVIPLLGQGKGCLD